MKRFAAWLTAGALALATVSPTTALANNQEDLGKVVAGAIGLLILKEIIDNKKDDKRSARTAKPQKHVHKPKQNSKPKVHKAPHHAHVPLRPNGQYAGKLRHALPQQCLRHLHTDRGMRAVFGRKCMMRHYHAVHRLPENCLRSHWTHKGWRHGWAPRCLSRNGYVW
ncbi:MAG: hypothetical protein ACU0DW_06560 [Shimia sp.]